MRAVLATLCILVTLHQLPVSSARGPELPHSSVEFARTKGSDVLNCQVPGRKVKVSFTSIKMPSGKTFSMYQPSVNQQMYHPRYYTISNATTFEECAHVADQRDALMFEIHDGGRCHISFFQYNRYKQRIFCKRDNTRHLFMLEGAKRKGRIRDGVCSLKDKSLVKRYHDVKYESSCNKITYDCKTSRGRPTVVGGVFEDAGFGCIYRHHHNVGTFNEGRKFCKTLKAKLYIAKTDADRNAFLAYHKKEKVQTSYIGLRRRYKSRKWKWMGYGFRFYNTSDYGWMSGYPCDRAHYTCAIVVSGKGLLKNGLCDRKLRNICYKPRQSPKLASLSHLDNLHVV